MSEEFMYVVYEHYYDNFNIHSVFTKEQDAIQMTNVLCKMHGDGDGYIYEKFPLNPSCDFLSYYKVKILVNDEKQFDITTTGICKISEFVPSTNINDLNDSRKFNLRNIDGNWFNFSGKTARSNFTIESFHLTEEKSLECGIQAIRHWKKKTR